MQNSVLVFFFFFQAEDGIRDHCGTGVQTCALPILRTAGRGADGRRHPHQWNGVPGRAQARSAVVCEVSVDGRQVKKLIGRAWTKSARPPAAGYLTGAQAEEALQALLVDARRNAGKGEGPRIGATFAEAASEFLRY